MIELTRRNAVLSAAAAGLASTARPARAQGAAGTAAIDRLLGQAVETGQLAGVVALAATDKGTVYQGAFGKRSLAAGGADMLPDSVFWIASMTKAVTSAAADGTPRAAIGTTSRWCSAGSDTLRMSREHTVMPSWQTASIWETCSIA